MTVFGRTKKVFQKILRITGWSLAVFVLLLSVAILSLRLPFVQHKITQQSASYLQDKIGTPVSLGRAYIGFPKRIVIENFYVEDQQQDTLLFVGELNIDIDLWALTRNRIELNSISILNTIAYVNRLPNDSTFPIAQAISGCRQTLGV